MIRSRNVSTCILSPILMLTLWYPPVVQKVTNPSPVIAEIVLQRSRIPVLLGSLAALDATMRFGAPAGDVTVDY
jgi:hypothetical protein